MRGFLKNNILTTRARIGYPIQNKDHKKEIAKSTTIVCDVQIRDEIDNDNIYRCFYNHHGKLCTELKKNPEVRKRMNVQTWQEESTRHTSATRKLNT